MVATFCESVFGVFQLVVWFGFGLGFLVFSFGGDFLSFFFFTLLLFLFPLLRTKSRAQRPGARAAPSHPAGALQRSALLFQERNQRMQLLQA